jgi:hypothetical protein
MRASPHCLVAISSHGFGHLTQIACVLNAYGELMHAELAPQARFSVRSTLPAQRLRERIRIPIMIDPNADDFGMVMHDAMRCDLPASLARYIKAHAHWDKRIEQMAQRLYHQKVDVVFSNIPYMTLAAAQRAGIASLALCSLNWADILEQSVKQLERHVLHAAGISWSAINTLVQTMRDAYGSAGVFLQPTPSMPMHGLANARTIAPVCDPLGPSGTHSEGHAARVAIMQQVRQTHPHIDPDSWLVLVSMGGIPTAMDTRCWPTSCLQKPITYLLPSSPALSHPGAVSLGTNALSAMSFQTLIQHSDLIISKPGYGTFVEAWSAGTPLLYVQRNDWPESVALTQWLHAQLPTHGLSLSQWHQGNFESAMTQLLSRPRSQPHEPQGRLQAAHVLASMLR